METDLQTGANYTFEVNQIGKKNETFYRFNYFQILSKKLFLLILEALILLLFVKKRGDIDC